jgi:predicted  nucleic acid-binding Zn-ribbon protein
MNDPDGATTPDDPLHRLLAVQEQDTAADQLRHRQEHLAERAAVTEHEALVAGTQADQSAKEERREELALAQKRLEDEVASLETRIGEVTRLMHSGTVSAARELQALQHEQGSLRRRQDHLETEELEIMEELDPLEVELAELAQRLEDLGAEGERLAAALTDAEGSIVADLAELAERRATAVDGIPDDLLAAYDRLRQRLGGVAVARLAGGVCGGCHLGLSAVEVDRIKREPPDAIVHCEECGRMLVR